MKSTRSFGAMSVTQLFPSSLPAPRTKQQVVSSFLVTAEGYAHRWLDTRKGILLLQMAPYDSASGSIYVYDCERDAWYRLSFESIDDTFTVELFEQAYKEYKLLAYAEQPGLLLNLLDGGEDHPIMDAESPASFRRTKVEGKKHIPSIEEEMMRGIEVVEIPTRDRHRSPLAA